MTKKNKYNVIQILHLEKKTFHFIQIKQLVLLTNPKFHVERDEIYVISGVQITI
jgi:hypothetical protein